jgi:hypothetical protein
LKEIFKNRDDSPFVCIAPEIGFNYFWQKGFTGRTPAGWARMEQGNAS